MESIVEDERARVAVARVEELLLFSRLLAIPAPDFLEKAAEGEVVDLGGSVQLILIALWVHF